MATPDEREILKIIDAEGGESTVGKVASKMGLDTSYCRVILNSMGRNDYIDVFRDGKLRILSKGWSSLGKQSELGL